MAGVLQAGRETDVQVALCLGYGWRTLHQGVRLLAPPAPAGFFYDPEASPLQLVPHFSTDMRAAAQPLELLSRLCLAGVRWNGQQWVCELWGLLVGGESHYLKAYGSTPMLAICHATRGARELLPLAERWQ